jgi:anti-sigma factor RsiW
MSAITCLETEVLIELYAAGECDAAERRAVERHLAACPGCARAHEEARQTVGLLELRLREPEGLRRLHDRIESEASPRRSLRSAPRWQRTLAVAAMLLLTLGLAALLAPRGGWDGGSPVAVAWAEKGSRWTARGGEIDLSEGELAVRSAGAVKVRTPGGVATVEAGECFIAVRPGAAAEVRIAVNAGKVKLRNAAGVEEARAGEVLHALKGAAPRRQVEALALRFGPRRSPLPPPRTG